MRRMLAAGAAIVTCVALGGLPALPQGEAAAERETAADAALFHAVPDAYG